MLLDRMAGLLAVFLFLAPSAGLAAEPQRDATVVLVSLDGFRHDYASRYRARRIQEIAAAGSVADGLIPVFPSMTFSSHYSIVTGMYPDHHGIVDNVFFDPLLSKQYNFARQSAEAEWYRGTPLWTLAEQQGIRTAVMGWPGVDAPVGNVRPTFSLNYAWVSKATHDQQVEQALEWLRLPATERPRFIALYFSEADSTAHKFGPDSAEVESAVRELDRTIGNLWDGLLKVGAPVNLIVVSDHGMLRNGGTVMLRDFTDLTRVRVVQGGGAIVHVYAPEPEVQDRVYQDLRKGRNAGFEVYRRGETPKRWHYGSDPRTGDLLIVPTKPLVLNGRASDVPGAPPFPSNLGGHGYDASLFPEMNGAFFAAGPNLRQGKRLPPFENIHVYPLVARILGLKLPAGIDGSASVLDGIYQAQKSEQGAARRPR